MSELLNGIARLAVLYEDLRIEIAELRTIQKEHEQTGAPLPNYRVIYFLRCALTTIFEFRRGLTVVRKSPKFKQAAADLPAALTEEWTEDVGNEGQLFPSYARLLPVRGTPAAESRYSWTIDFAARRKQARENMKPHIAEAECARAEVVALKEKLKALKTLKTAGPRDERIDALEAEIWEREKAARDSQAAADAIDMAVFDLKAVNPNAVLKIDTRTSAEVIQSIEDHGNAVARALETLKTLLQA